LFCSNSKIDFRYKTNNENFKRLEAEQLVEINRKLESISNHYDFFKKKMDVLDKIETAILGNEYNKRGFVHMLDDFESRIKVIEENIIIMEENILQNSKKIENWDKALVAIIIAVAIFEITKHFIK